MPLEIVTIPCLSDNYAYLIHNDATGETAAVDVPEAAPIAAELKARGWTLTDILITHHHADHIDGVPALVQEGVRLVGAAADAHRMPALDLAVSEGDALTVCGADVQIFEVYGHTVGHIAFYIPEAKAAFTADSLMTLGCGRLSEGTPPQMWESLSKLAALPPETLICSGHEYTQANARFAVTIEPDNAALQARAKDIDAKRAQGLPTVPDTLQIELDTNPFLRARLPGLKHLLGMENAADDAVFAEIRGRKDRF